MKCPKCSYLGLDNGDRCKHCGYEFSLIGSPENAPSSTPGRPRATPLNLPPTPRPDPARPRSARVQREPRATVDGALGLPLKRSADSAPLDLPLFDLGFSQGTSLPPPHRPLGVRRSGVTTPARPRAIAERATAGALPLELESPSPASSQVEMAPAVVAISAEPVSATRRGPIAQGWRRAGSWLIDFCLVVLVDLLTVYFTLRVCGLDPAEWDILPVVPLLGFLIILNGGYVIVLTATLGQTLGKMAMRLEVVADDQAAVGMARATLRTLAALLSLLPAGLGFVWTLIGDGRALHDRVTRTRVVHVTLT